MASTAFKLDYAVSFETETCINCGILFALPAHLMRDRRRDHSNFYCPNGHPMIYTSKSDVELAKAESEKLRAEIEKTKAEAAEKIWQAQRMADEAERELAAVKRAQAKERKRVANGVCPCCNRSFVNLRRHIATKHPEHHA